MDCTDLMDIKMIQCQWGQCFVHEIFEKFFRESCIE
jgi:hypothetical protein